ncbi:MAG: thiamine phosphate synthase [SAR202 cluster bacterium]|jgi:thiamine-phosphate pyrophosphorylase|nr:thiamine phosphate synthase [Chloroflexota bacterium]MDP6421273.1 thiamine phosphate synthase [SAR202 cluster bacterium]HAL48785.1 thiamine phosphate synthase [Dehalococcoidia bacterium]MDP6664838.1 thiamine phosphate synthase [SAR202 cluster bacterium]MDP6801371.1 thiamine phosphate synthase [SAR202 cluster bacterium]|tara:strand:- start:3185 stop:4189 length:1005 start_codon:yes stop_codon:yes gene_type:complete
MNPYVSAQISSLVEGLRLLEVYVTAPLALHTDIRMMRESLPFPLAKELSRDETSLLRQGHAELTDDHAGLALDAISAIRATAHTLVGIRGQSDAALDESWLRRARLVLHRAEQQVSSDVRSAMAQKVAGIYVIVDPEATQGRPVEEVARATLEGGARVIQLRSKLDDKKIALEQANAIKELCDEHDAVFFVNDDADVARAANAHGLHIGQTDLPTEASRMVITQRQIVGRSNNGLEQALESHAQGVDCIAVGAIYSTSTMGKSGRTALGPEAIREVKDAVPRPIIAIGGIGTSNIVDVVEAGADCVCVVSAITFADDPEAATRELVRMFEGASG